jgi:hypothetical protein
MDHLNEEILQSLLENRMSRVAQAQVRHHVRTCFRCEQKLREWRESFDSLSEEPPASRPAGQSHPVGSEPTVLVPAKPIILSKHSRRVVRTMLAVGVALVAVLIFETFRQGRLPGGVEGAPAASALIERSEAALQEGIDPSSPGRDDTPVVVDSTANAGQDQGAPPDPTAAAPSVAGEAVVPAPTPARPLGVSAPGFSVITVREAIEQKGGPLQLIRGLLPDHIEVADASAVPGALPGSKVLRVVYREPNGRVLLLDQQRISPEYRSGLATDILIDSGPGGNSIALWVSGETRLTLSGRMDPETLRVFVNRVD